MVMTTKAYCDIAIVGGGIAGLWLRARLRQQSFTVALIEANALGSGQTLHSQGIIHGGLKYSLQGQLSTATQAIQAMPERWQRCLADTGELDLRSAKWLAQEQLLFTTQTLGSRLAGFFASKTLNAAVRSLNAKNYPEFFHNPHFKGQVYALPEPVLQIDTVLAALVKDNYDGMLRGHAVVRNSHTLQIQYNGAELWLKARQIICTAGAGNGIITDQQQLRPLHMVLVRGTLPPFYGHCLGSGDKPRLTITSHQDQQRRMLWYLGGQLAEQGVARSATAQIACAKRELAQIFPWLDWDQMQYATLHIDRAEGRQVRQQRPDYPVVLNQQGILLAWPTKLALTPLLADQILNYLQHLESPMRTAQPLEVLNWPKPTLGHYPWDQDLIWN